MKNDVFQMFDSIGAFWRGGGLASITLLKIGFYCIFNKFFHWISVIIMSRMLWDHDERSVIIFKLFESWWGWWGGGEKYSWRPILEKRIESKCLMKNFTWTRFRAQFWLNFFETWYHSCFYRVLVLYSLEPNRPNEGRD